MKKGIVLLLIVFSMSIFGDEFTSEDIQKFKKICESAPLYEYGVVWVTDLCLDHEGSVYILDANNKKIVKLSPELKFMKSFGKKGQGPGEFNSAYKLSADRSGNIYLVENMVKVIKFSGSGEFLKESRISGFTSVSFGKVIDYPVFIGKKFNKDFSYKLQIFNIEAKSILKEYKILESSNFAVKTNMGYLAPSIPFVGGHSFFETNGKYCIAGEGERFSVNLFDNKGNTITSVKKEIEARKLKKEEKEFLIKKVMQMLPGKKDRKEVEKLVENYKFKNFIHKLLLSENYFYVFPVPEDISISDKFPVEIYNFKGELVRKSYFPKVPEKISENYAFVIEKEEIEDEEVTKIVKYKIQIDN